MVALGLLGALLFSYRFIHFSANREQPGSNRDEFERILANKEVSVVVDHNSANYFMYKGHPVGFQYELLKQFCTDNGLELKLQVNNNLQQSFDGLLNGEYDLIARNLVITTHRSEQIEFTEPWGLTRQILVQRAKNHRGSSVGETPSTFISDHIELGEKTIVISGNSTFRQRLRNLSDEIGEPIHVVVDSLHSTEQLVALVATGAIDYTVCDAHTGSVLRRFFPGLDFSIPVSFNQKYAWGIRKNETRWKDFLDEWITGFKESGRFEALYNKYFTDNFSRSFAINRFNSIQGGGISDYDAVIRDVAAYYDWDWRLIASMVMQESGFDPEASSWMGAAGLMQLMPATAELYRVDDVLEPRENIRGGIAYLTWIDELFQPLVPDTDERIKFVLASYNAGIGHVMDARKLAMKYDFDPSLWDNNVAYFMQNKSQPAYYSDPLVRWGYCRGDEPVNYVNEIIDRYGHYLNTLPPGQHVALAAN